MSSEPLGTEAILARLVSFNTQSADTNLPLIDWVESYVTGLGFKAVRVPDPTMPKACLFVTVGPTDRGGICLSGHTDVVPVEGQAWSTDPFELVARGDKLYGRGACDMKGFLAACLAKLPAFRAANLTTPIHVILSYDEETTCEGVVTAINHFGHDLPMPIATIVGEPTEMRVATAHKSAQGFITTIKGREAHSANPTIGASALIAGHLLIGELERYAAELRGRGDPSGQFHPPYSTVHIGSFHSGTARNIVPNTARLHWEVRGLPELDIEEIPRRFQAFVDTVALPYLKQTAPEAEIATEREFTIPGVKPEPGSLAERIAFRLTRTNETMTVSYGTEGGRFQAVNIPTVVCGPGSIEQAHKPDEWIAVSELRRCEAFLDGLTEMCRAGV